MVDANSEIEEKVKVKLCTAADTTYLGSIWEINFSTSNMVIWVMKFSREGYIFCQKSAFSNENIVFCELKQCSGADLSKQAKI